MTQNFTEGPSNADRQPLELFRSLMAGPPDTILAGEVRQEGLADARASSTALYCLEGPLEMHKGPPPGPLR